MGKNDRGRRSGRHVGFQCAAGHVCLRRPGQSHREQSVRLRFPHSKLRYALPGCSLLCYGRRQNVYRAAGRKTNSPGLFSGCGRQFHNRPNKAEISFPSRAIRVTGSPLSWKCCARSCQAEGCLSKWEVNIRIWTSPIFSPFILWQSTPT